MRWTQSILALLPLALTALATPLGCSNTFPGDFTLTAYNVTSFGTLDLRHGEQIVGGQNGAIDGAEFEILSTLASYPYDQFSSMTLKNGFLRFHDSNANGNLVGYDSTVNPGDLPTFVIGNDPPPETAQYCAKSYLLEHRLALNGDANSFYLCVAGDWPLAQNNIVYAPVQGNFAYEFSTCHHVALLLTPTSS